MLRYAMHTMLCTRRPGKEAQDIGILPAEVQLQAILHASPRDCKWADVFRLRRPASHSSHSIATHPQQSTRLRASHARRLHQRRSAVRCMSIGGGAHAWSRRCRPARGPSRRNLIVEWGCASPGCISVTHTQHAGATTNPRQHPPTAAHGVCQASRQDKTLPVASLYNQSHMTGALHPGRLQ